MSGEIHVSIFGEEEIPKLDLMRDYIKTKNINEVKPKKGRLFFSINSTKVKIYEFSDTPEKKIKI